MKTVSRPALLVVMSLLLLACASTAAWGACPSSPNYSTNFNSESPTPTCITLNGNASALAGDNVAVRLTPISPFQAGSAWFNTQQTVQNGFSTTFSFRLGDSNTNTPADGIAFVIQSSGSGVLALGGAGGAMGFATNGTPGISNSLAIEFDSFNNGTVDSNNGNHVAIQSCGANQNTYFESGTGSCNVAVTADLSTLQTPIQLYGSVHTATITYVPPCPTPTCNPAKPGTIDVILDNQDLFPNGSAQYDL